MVVTDAGIVVVPLQPNISLFVDVSIIALYEDWYVLLPVTVIVVRFVQPKNDVGEMLVTVEGISIVVSFFQPSNARFSMVVTPLGIVMFSTFSNPLNAASPIV